MAGAFTLVLSMHRPWLGADPCPEDEWLLASLAGCYLPLVDLLERLREDGVRAPVAVAISPTLTAMLDDPVRRARLHRALADREAACSRAPDRPGEALSFHRERFKAARLALEGSACDIPGRLRALEEDGCIDLLACAATNALLPLLPQPKALQAQLRLAAAEHRRRFRGAAAGLWLPECGWDRRVGPAAAEAGFEYVFLEHHALERARPRPRCGAYAPVRATGGVFAFARDPELVRAAARLGPYAHPDYAELAFDVGPEIGDGRPMGLHTRKVGTKGTLADKPPYEPAAARAAAETQAEEFAQAIEARAARLALELRTRPALTAAFEAELFGHEWLEGPYFLERLLRRLAAGTNAQPKLPEWVLAHAPEAEEVEPECSTWGPGGYLDPWLRDENAWVVPHAHGLTERMLELAARFGPKAEAYPSPLEERALDACARLTALAQASDWGLLAGSRRQASWAGESLAKLVSSFLTLRGQLEERAVDADALAKAERASRILPDADFRVYA
ncbi:MAG: DUF1957 domain-containing protein [Elusimicrobia bacterium]|nr:DUF1957 domain-containing protein [Elusimicrobiota bacterium]